MNTRATEPDQVDYWQQQSNKFTTPFDRDKHLLETGLYSDCQFLVGGDNGTDQEVFKAHKIFLAQSSPVFHAMFFGEVILSTLDGENDVASLQNKVIAVPDVTPSSFKALLQYIYTKTMNLQSLDQAMGLCYAAHKYILPDLFIAECQQYIENNLCPEYTLKVLEFTKFFENESLKAKCLFMLREWTHRCLASSDFEDVDKSMVLAIVKEKTMNIRELDLFDAVVRWAKHQCVQNDLEINGTNLRQVLEGIIHQFLFLTMTLKEFSSSPLQSGILTENERSTILVHLNNQDTSITPMPSHFSSNRNQRQSRRFASRSIEICFLRRITYEKPVCLVPAFPKFVALTVDRDIMITGIVLANTDLEDSQMKGFSEMTVVSNLLDSNDDTIGSATVSRPMTRFIKFLAVFNRPVSLKRDEKYRIRIDINRRANFLLGNVSARSEVCQGQGVRFQFSACWPSDDEGMVRGVNFFLGFFPR